MWAIGCQLCRALALGAGLCLVGEALAQEPAEPPEPAPQAEPPRQPADTSLMQRDLLVLVRALAYDRTLSERFGTELHVGVLHKGDKPLDEAAAAVAVLRALADVKIGGLAVSVVPIRWSDQAALDKHATEDEVDVIFVPAGMDAGAVAASAVARAHARTTMTRSRAYLSDPGLSLGVEDVDGKPRILVNLAAAKAEGASYASELLRLAEVVK